MNVKLIEGTKPAESLQALENLTKDFAPVYREAMRHLIASTWNLLATEVNNHAECQREGTRNGHHKTETIWPK